MKVLITNLMMLADTQRFREELLARQIDPVFAFPEQFFDEESCIDLVGDIDGWLAGDDQITAAVLDKALPRLKVISKWGTGMDSIDLSAAKDRSVPVFNSPGAFQDAVAETAMCFMLELARNTLGNDARIRQGAWPKEPSDGLVGRRLGLVGCGAIGRGIALRAQAFGMSVSFYDPFFTGDEFGWTRVVSLDGLLPVSDYLCLACNMSEENHHLIGSHQLAKLPRGARVINVARGPLIDEAALVSALQQGHIGGAGLDVFEVEPLSLESPLRHLPDVILGSHNANNVISVVEKVHANTLSNLFRGLKVSADKDQSKYSQKN